MSELKEISVSDIFDSIEVSLTSRDLELVLNHNQEALDKIREAFQRNNKAETFGIKRLKYMLNASATRKVCMEFEDSVDKEALVVLTLYNHQNMLESGNSFSDAQKKDIRKYISNAIRLIGRKDFNVIDLEYNTQSGLIAKVNVINSQELVACIKRKSRISNLGKLPKNDEERAEQIEEEIDFDNIAQVLILDDVQDIISYDAIVGRNIVAQISYNGLRMFARIHHGIDEETLQGQKPLEDEKEKEVKDSREFKEAFTWAVKANLKHLDMNKLLLVSAFRYIDMIENDEEGMLRIGTIEDEEVTRESSLDVAHELVSMIRQSITKETTIEGIKGSDGIQRRYSLKDLDRDLSRFVKGDFIRIATIKKAKEQLLLGEKTLNEINIEVVKRVIFSDEELMALIKLSEDNLIFLIEHNIVEQEEIYAALHLRNECSLKLFKLIIDKNMLSGSQILKLYEYGIIALEHIKSIEDIELLNSINVDSKVKAICISMQNVQENEEIRTIEHFNKLAALYKLLRLEGKSEEEIKGISNGLVASFEEDLSNDILEKLYQFGIISLDIAADWGVDLTELMTRGEMRPIDLKRLYENKTIKIEEIKNVLLHSELSYEEKLDLIYSTFDGESEEEYNTREELVQLLENGESYRAEPKRTGTKRNTGMGEKSKEYITDPHARWKLISLLDEEYSKKFLPKGKEVIDGHRVFLLPNLDSIVIERMYEKRKGKKVTAYGSATYIMETEEFFKHIENIIVEGAINRTGLRELSESDSTTTTKIIHSRAWGENIKKYFDINEENERYSKEEIEQIDAAIAKVNNSRKER